MATVTGTPIIFWPCPWLFPWAQKKFTILSIGIILQESRHQSRGNYFFSMVVHIILTFHSWSITGIDKNLDLEKSREEMTPYFLARSRKLDFHFSFYSWCSRFLEKISISLLDLWDFLIHSLSLFNFQDV